MARPLSAEEQQRYPWASQITDFVPVGRWRRIALWITIGGICIFCLGTGFLVVTSNTAHGGFSLSGTAGQAVLYVSLAALWAGCVMGIAGVVSAIVKSARGPMVWSIATMVPGLLALFLAVR